MNTKIKDVIMSSVKRYCPMDDVEHIDWLLGEEVAE